MSLLIIFDCLQEGALLAATNYRVHACAGTDIREQRRKIGFLYVLPGETLS